MLLAHAGLFDDRRCTVHWASVQAMQENFHRAIVTGNIFCVDGRLITCAGGISTLDMMLHLIERFSSSQLAFNVADAPFYPSKRGDDEPARRSLVARTGVVNRQLTRAVELMEANIETPISITGIGKRTGALLSGENRSSDCRSCTSLRFSKYLSFYPAIQRRIRRVAQYSAARDSVGPVEFRQISDASGTPSSVRHF